MRKPEKRIKKGRKKLKREFGLPRFIFAASVIVLIGAIFLLWSFYGFVTSEFPDVSLLKTRYAVVIDQGPKKLPLVRLQKARPPRWVSLNEISKAAIGAVVVSEDWAFYQHSGYDPVQIKEAIKEDLEKGGFSRGASTITQQVVKNVFLNREKSLWRKIKELILAVRLERSVGKRRILEIYFNVAEWGYGIYGIRDASLRYFAKSPSELTPKEGAFLAMLLPSPKRYSQSFRNKALTRYADSTIRSILNKMVQARYLEEIDRDRELITPLSFETAGSRPEDQPEESEIADTIEDDDPPPPDQPEPSGPEKSLDGVDPSVVDTSQ